MSITVNGQSCVPPGFRFHPTEEELLNYYLRKKVASDKIDLDVICDVDLNKLEPWDIQEKCRIGWTPQSDWYFFSHKDKKYPTGTRTNRATVAGFWKATGRDKVICTSSKRIGMRKTLVFYKGRAPHGQKSDWIMHEYRLDDPSDSNGSFSSVGDASAQEDGWVVCRVFKKKNFHRAMDSPNNNCSSITCDAKTQMLRNCSGGGGTLDHQIHQYMGRSCKQETDAMMINSVNQTARHLRPIETVSGGSFSRRFMKLPALESPTLPSPTDDFPIGAGVSCFNKSSYQPGGSIHAGENANRDYLQPEPNLNDWTVLDRLVASHLNGQSDASKHLACLDDNEFLFSAESHDGGGDGSGDGDGADLWSLASYASDHIGHLSHGPI